jgi:hypothetical protein
MKGGQEDSGYHGENSLKKNICLINPGGRALN